MKERTYASKSNVKSYHFSATKAYFDAAGPWFLFRKLEPAEKEK